ncbi:MAG: hypothetical protein PHW04_00710 [Candidatus Wallbacteria bacterium]|nr:hypothetical protein [Candidatus Wallbacteria bacterium]
MKVWKCKCGEINLEQEKKCGLCRKTRKNEVVEEMDPVQKKDVFPESQFQKSSILEESSIPILKDSYLIPKKLTIDFFAGIISVFLAGFVFYYFRDQFKHPEILHTSILVIIVCLLALLRDNYIKGFITGIFLLSTGFLIIIPYLAYRRWGSSSIWFLLSVLLLPLLFFGACTISFIKNPGGC